MQMLLTIWALFVYYYSGTLQRRSSEGLMKNRAEDISS